MFLCEHAKFGGKSYEIFHILLFLFDSKHEKTNFLWVRVPKFFAPFEVEDDSSPSYI